MGFSDSVIDGFALAAAAAGDDGVAASSSIAPAHRGAVRRRLDGLAALDARTRRREVHELALRLAPDLDDAVSLSRRARALIASELDRRTGARYLAEAPPPRSGFVADGALLGVIRRAAARGLGRQARKERELRWLTEVRWDG